MDMEYNTGLMELIMKDNGLLTKQRVKVHFGMLKETSTVEISRTIWQMDMVITLILTEVDIRVSSKTMFRRAMEKKNGSTEPNMLEHT
jgi:hypothetical protein